MSTIAAVPCRPTTGENGVTVEAQFLRLRSVSWGTYRALAQALAGRHLRLTYDRGTLEFMTISYLHGSFSRLLLFFVQVLAEEMSMTFRACGDMTLERADLERGIEADEAFYLKHEPLVRGRAEIDLSRDPPPDLAAEIDIARDSRRRMPTYEAIAVPEVWRFDGTHVTIHVRGADGRYFIADRSLAFPVVTGPDLASFLLQQGQADENSIVRAFRVWVREQITRTGKA